MNISRRDTLRLAVAASLTAGTTGLARAQEQVVIDPLKLMAPTALPDHPMGNDAAKVTVIEYGSATCPHCGRFARDVFPSFKEKYVDTDKVKFIFRPFALNVLDLAVFMLAETAGPDQYYTVLETYYAHQDQWVTSDKPGDAIKAIALQLGFTEETYQGTLKNQDLAEKVQKERDQASDDFKITGTPTFFVNGRQLVGEQTLDEMSAAIDPLLA